MYLGSLQPNISFVQGCLGSSVGPGMNGFGGFNPSFGSFGTSTSSSSSSSSSSVMSEEKRIEKYEKNKKILNEKRTQRDELEKIIDKADNAVQEKDGTFTEKEKFTDYKKQPWWKKTLRAVGNMATGLWKMCEGFAGFEKDPETGEKKFKPLKLLKNVAIAGVLVAATCIPGVGPFISTGLLALGVATGVLGITKGIVKASKAAKADNMEEYDHAFQDIGQGVAIGVTSAFGLRGLGKGLSAANELNAAKGLTTITESTCKSGIGQFFLDMTVNAGKATKVASISSKYAMTQAGGGLNFWQAWGKNITAKLPKFGKKGYESKLNETNTRINERMRKLEAEWNNPNLSQEQQSLISKEYDMLVNQQRELASATTKAQWKNLTKGSEAMKHCADLKNVKVGQTININGTDIVVTKDNIAQIRSLSTRAEMLSNDVARIAKLRNSSMKWMTLSKNNAADVNAYNGANKNTRLGRYLKLIGPDSSKSWFGKTLYWIKTPIKWAFVNLLGITYKPYNLISKSPAAAWYNFESTFIVPAYEEPMLREILGMGDKKVTTDARMLREILGMGNKKVTIDAPVKDKNGQISSQTIDLNLELYDKLKKEYDKIQKEINKLNQEQEDLFC